MKRILVLGSSGLIGSNLIKRLKLDGDCWVRGIDRREPEFERSAADEFNFCDLRTLKSNDPLFEGMDECYQLAADMGGMGYLVPKNDADVMRNSMTINLNVLEACTRMGVGRVFFSSSACVYPDIGSCKEDNAYPAMPEIEYGWEKLFAERLYFAYSRCYGVKVRVGRLHNVYGPLGCYEGGREKAPAALCRKVAMAEPYGSIDMWGSGEQTRSFMWIEDCLEGIIRLMRSDFEGPVNIGSAELVTINQLAHIIMMVANKQLTINHIDGPIGVNGRNSDNTVILEKLGWAPRTPLHIGIAKLYPWVKAQIEAKRKAA